MTESQNRIEAEGQAKETSSVTLTPAEMKARKGRNLAIALGLFIFVALVFIITLARLGANVLNRPI